MSNANSKEAWDEIWAKEGLATWRTYPSVYDRIVKWMPQGTNVVDLGCGVGILSTRLRKEKSCPTTGVDISSVAIGHYTRELMETSADSPNPPSPPISGAVLNFEDPADSNWNFVCNALANAGAIVATEFLEHLTDDALMLVMDTLGDCEADQKLGFFAVPNYCLGPDEEPQHHRKFSAIEFKLFLERYWGKGRVRVECWDHYLLGVCGFQKSYRLSVTFPAKDEAADVERTLKSFMAVADEVVIGVDYRSRDATFEVASRYADKVFIIEDPLGPPGEEVDNPNGVHFAHIRNRCIEKCTGDWIFMTEAHESLKPESIDYCFGLDDVPSYIGVLAVVRTGANSQWLFPWVFRNDPRIRFKNPVHNVLAYPDEIKGADWPQVYTHHFRDHGNAKQRSKQRAGQNRQIFLQRLIENSSDTRSRFYLAQEYKGDGDLDKAIEQYYRYLRANSDHKNERYQARMSLANCLAIKGQLLDARNVLLDAHKDDWSRNEHYIFLGDLALRVEQYEEALLWYRIASSWTEPPLSPMWVDTTYYTFVPQMKMSQAFAALGKSKEALACVERVKAYRLNDPTATAEDLAIIEQNIELCREMLAAKGDEVAFNPRRWAPREDSKKAPDSGT